MKKSRTLFYPIFIFVLAQFAWFVMVGLWIYRYITSNMISEYVGEHYSIQIVSKSANVVALVGGLILMITVSVAMALIFRNLTSQLKITIMYDNFIANVTHELKSPLSSIQLYLETLNTRSVTPEKQKEFVNIMIKDAARLKNLIESILSISGMELKKIPFDYQLVDAGETFQRLFRESTSQLKLGAESVSITGNAPYSCVIDPNTMRMVVDNLVDNAIKYSQSSPQITMDLSIVRNHVVVKFIDNGIGIDQEEQKHIFKKFHRVYNRSVPNVKGTGLGLYFVKEIIKTHGGRVTVQSEGIGKGTTFRIELPIYQAVKQRYINNLLKLAQKRKNRQEEINE